MFRETEAVVFGDEEIQFRLVHQDLHTDQGVVIDVLGVIDGQRVQLVRFNCFDHSPNYLYGPDQQAVPNWIDQTTEGDPLEWAIEQIRQRLPKLIERAGYKDLAERVDSQSLATALSDMAQTARKMASEQRETVIHDRGDVIVEAGPIRFGLNWRGSPSFGMGVAIHVLGDVGGEEHEMLAFDCFDRNAHYHYGPRLKNQRLYPDYTVTPDPLRWALDLLKGGKLAPMLERAGYADYAARLNPVTVAQKVAEVEKVALEMEAGGRPQGMTRRPVAGD